MFLLTFLPPMSILTGCAQSEPENWNTTWHRCEGWEGQCQLYSYIFADSVFICRARWFVVSCSMGAYWCCNNYWTYVDTCWLLVGQVLGDVGSLPDVFVQLEVSALQLRLLRNSTCQNGNPINVYFLCIVSYAVDQFLLAAATAGSAYEGYREAREGV